MRLRGTLYSYCSLSYCSLVKRSLISKVHRNIWSFPSLRNLLSDDNFKNLDISLAISYILNIYNHLSTKPTPFSLSGLTIKISLLICNFFKTVYFHKTFFVGLYKLTYEFAKYDHLTFILPASLLFLRFLLIALYFLYSCSMLYNFTIFWKFWSIKCCMIYLSVLDKMK